MPDALARRAIFGVLAPSTNTIVEPDFHRMAVAGVTAQTARIHIRDASLADDAAFEALIAEIETEIDAACERIVTCRPDRLVMGMSAETFWGGAEGNRVLRARVEGATGLPLVTGADAVERALRAYGVRRVAVLTPYQPVGDANVRRFLGETGFEVVRLTGLRCPTAHSIAAVTEERLRAALLALDGDDVDALLQVGTNLSMVRLADEAERWLGKPVIAINAATWWRALRDHGIEDRVEGAGGLLREHREECLRQQVCVCYHCASKQLSTEGGCAMELQGLHHVTMITADARRTVDFYARTLGLRLVKKTVNFDQPGVYHLYFGDERGTPGSILTWFEFPDAAPGRPGAGQIHTIELGVGSAGALDFWERRLREAGVAAEREGEALRFEDPDGLRFALVPSAAGNPPLRAEHPEIPLEHAIAGVEGARAYAAAGDGALLADVLGFSDRGGDAYRLDGGPRSVRWTYDEAPAAPGRQGAGSVHHIAWASRDDDHLGWQRAIAAAGTPVTGVRDRDYFRSIYFPEPHGVLFEIATLGPGFAVDEDPGHLGEELRVPAMHAHLRERLERTLTPLENPRAALA